MGGNLQQRQSDPAYKICSQTFCMMGLKTVIRESPNIL